MKTTTINKGAESLKKSISNASKNSKESIKSLIELNSKQFDGALEANQKAFDSISKMLYEKELDTSLLSSFKTSFDKSAKLSEDVIDSIIDSHTTRIDLSIDFTTKFMEIINNEDFTTQKGIDKLIELVKENFDNSTELSVDNMKKMVSVYNDHLNLALNFNKKFVDNINSQIQSMFKLQKRTFDTFFSTDMINEWWKDGEKKD